MLCRLLICFMIVRNCAAAGTCEVGDPVMCSSGGPLCSGNQCCPDGHPCPSASSTFRGCSVDVKLEDCTSSEPVAAGCQAGDVVSCSTGGPSDGGVTCAGNQCCSNGHPCPSALPDFKGCTHATKLKDCTGLRPSPLGPPASTPSPTPMAITGGSPALAWHSVPLVPVNPKAEKGLEKIKRIANARVIDNFLAENPDLKDIFWGDLSEDATVELAVAYAKKLCLDTTLETFMKDKGFTMDAKQPTHKGSFWTNLGTSERLFAKHTTDFKEVRGPNNGFMRIFYQDVFMKLHKFNPEYGWDNGLTAGLWDGKHLQLIGFYSQAVPLEKTPRTWVLPQMHYLGVLPLDLHFGNFAMVKDNDEGVPVDLDATWRGPPTDKMSAFMKLVPIDARIQQMENEYLTIDGILQPKSQFIQLTAVLSPSMTWSAALGGLLGSSLVVAAITCRKKSYSDSSKPLLA